MDADKPEDREHPIDKANRILWARQCEAEGVAKDGVSHELQAWAKKRAPARKGEAA